MEHVGNRIVSSVTIFCTGADGSVITKAMEELAAQWALCVLVEERRMRRWCCKAARVWSASQPERGELVPPPSQAPAPRT